MKSKFLFSFNIISLFLIIVNAQKTNFKGYYYEAFEFMKVENYNAALPILLDLEKLEDKNANILFSIGYCYLKTQFEKDKSIPYFEKILSNYKNLTVEYRPETHKEKKAPIETLMYLGQAYHYDYQFDKALIKYIEYKDVLDPNNTNDLRAINNAIVTTNTAIALVNNPIVMHIKPLNVLNTKYSEYRPKLTGDESLLYFTTRRNATLNSATDLDGKYFENIYVSENKNGAWDTPVLVSDKINSPSHDACLYIAPDNSYMIVYKSDESTSSEGAIFESFLKGNQWSDPVLISDEVNSKYWETDVNISADKQIMYFSSNRPGGQGGKDIWIMKKLPNGTWAKVQNLGNVINSPFDEESPYLHPDGKTLYFSSKGHGSMGGFDIFKSELQKDGSWSTPQNIGYPINTTGDDVFYFPSNDGKKAYFSSYRADGMGEQDIYELEFPQAIQNTLAIYKGKAFYSDGSIISDLRIDIENLKLNEKVGDYAVNEATGKFLFILPASELFLVTYTLDTIQLFDTIEVPQNGGIYNIDKIITLANGNLVFISEETLLANNNKNSEQNNTNISNLNDQDIQNKLDDGQTLVLNNLLFVYDKTQLIDKSNEDLSKLIKYLQNNPSKKISLEGHTDSKGTPEYNLNLSKQRSNQVKKALILAGISKNRIITSGFGLTKPIAENSMPDGSDNPQGRQANRRVEIKIYYE